MKSKINCLLFGLLTSGIIVACSSGTSNSSSTQSLVVGGYGYAYNTPESAYYNMAPVWWDGKNNIHQFPTAVQNFESYYFCGGSLSGLAASGKNVLAAGSISTCIGPEDDPIVWIHAGYWVNAESFIALNQNNFPLATANSILNYNGSTIVGGAMATDLSLEPKPTIWNNNIINILPIPESADGGAMVNSLITDNNNNLYAGGLIKIAQGVIRAIYWKVNLNNIQNSQYHIFTLDDPSGEELIASGPVVVSVSTTGNVSVSANYANSKVFKRGVVWQQTGNGFTPIGFGSQPANGFQEEYSSNSSLKNINGQTMIIGGISNQNNYGYESPAYGIGINVYSLNTVSSLINIGTGTDVTNIGNSIFISGYTFDRIESGSNILYSVASYWNNGNRVDLPGLQSSNCSQGAQCSNITYKMIPFANFYDIAANVESNNIYRVESHTQVQSAAATNIISVQN